MLSDISRELTTLLEADYGEDVREAIKDALSKINSNTIPTVEVTGVKGNEESEYRKGNINITKANIGLSNVNNTSDANKPISNLEREALDGKIGIDNIKGTNAFSNLSGALVSCNNSVALEISDFTISGRSVKVDNEIKSVGDSGNIKIICSGKNLLDFSSVTSKIANGINYDVTKNSSGNVESIHIHGTATEQSIAWMIPSNSNYKLPKGKFILSKCSDSYLDYQFFVNAYNGTDFFVQIALAGNSTKTKAFTIDYNGYDRVAIGFVVSSGKTVDAVCYPAIFEENTIDQSFEPYIGKAITLPLSSGLLGVPVNGRWISDSIGKDSGKLIKRCSIITEYSGESLPGAWISNMDEYVEGASPSNGAKVVYALSNPTEQNLASSQLAALDKLYAHNVFTNLYAIDSANVFPDINAGIPIAKPEKVSDVESLYFKMAEENGTKTIHIDDSDVIINAEENTRYACGEVSTLEFNPASRGMSDLVFTSGSSKTILTLPNTVKMPDWFEVEANMTYEISIMDGVYGVVTSWAV